MNESHTITVDHGNFNIDINKGCITTTYTLNGIDNAKLKNLIADKLDKSVNLILDLSKLEKTRLYNTLIINNTNNTLEDLKKNLTQIIFPQNFNNLTLGKECFSHCIKLKKVTFKSAPSYSTLKLGDSCFYGCTDLEEIHYPSQFKLNINDKCFDGCDKTKLKLSYF
jgi:hypothetical protein